MFTLPELSYSYDALSPYIDAKTMEIHLTKHHQAYIDNLNKALIQVPELQSWSLDQLLKKINQVPDLVRPIIQNHGGGHHNHLFFWNIMAPGAQVVQGALYQHIVAQFGSFKAFQEQFELTAKNRFGSGWAWLVFNGQGKLELYSTANQDSPLMKGDSPILGLDVWEHAYYLAYQNRRPDYIAAWWNVVNWDTAEQLYLAAAGK